MIVARRARRVVACLGIAMFLFAQLAAAAHACAAFATAGDMTVAAPHDAMPCDDLAPAGPAAPDSKICYAHCYAGASPVDHHPGPCLAAGGTYAVHPVDRRSAAASTARGSRDLLVRVTAPPLPVLHCRFLT